jgi:hypothetical protein
VIGKFDLWPKIWHDEPMSFPCALCLFICGERGHFEIEGVHLRVCVCCADLISTSRNLANQPKENTNVQ